jgi:asparagine synthase (glutamine-hydrolysing)
MLSPGGRFVLSYNGEIYNCSALRGELEREGMRFAGHCDTEVLLAGIEAWGVPATLNRCNGMFAFALWDRHEQSLLLARDRLGEKPLYYGRVGPHLLFASELGAIRRHPRLAERVDRSALASYLRYGYVPAPHSILQGIAKLGAGEMLTVHREAPERLEPVSWWSLADVARDGRAERRPAGRREDAEELHDLLADAVRLRMIADVPIGAFLSGGIDSSTIVALMQRHTGEPVRTYSVGFDEHRFNEADHAARVAKHLQTDHTELRLSAREATDSVVELPEVFDEPFADPALLPTLLVSRLARRDVTVAFAGDGGDELFHGYARYRWTDRLWQAMRPVSPGLRRRFSLAASALPPGPGNRLGHALGRSQHELSGDRLLKLAELAGAPDRDRLFERLTCWWPNPPVLGSSDGVNPVFNDVSGLLPADDPSGRMTLADSLSYLPDDILAKVDRATMSVSLEARVPLLDHRVVELAWRLAPPTAGAQGLGKRTLRDVLYRYVPPELVDRPKQGFALPLAEWLRGPLKPWAQALLEPGLLSDQGFIDPAVITRHWHEHQSRKRNWHHRLWTVLMFQSWLSRSHAT